MRDLGAGLELVHDVLISRAVSGGNAAAGEAAQRLFEACPAFGRGLPPTGAVCGRARSE
jgi:hypothetical protein